MVERRQERSIDSQAEGQERLSLRALIDKIAIVEKQNKRVTSMSLTDEQYPDHLFSNLSYNSDSDCVKKRIQTYALKQGLPHPHARVNCRCDSCKHASQSHAVRVATGPAAAQQ